MGYTQSAFLFIFLPVSILLYWGLSRFRSDKLQNAFAILISVAFYAWGSIDTLWLFLAFVLVVYLFGNVIYFAQQNGEIKRIRLWLAGGITSVTAFLVYFNYVSFIIEIFQGEQEAAGFANTLLVPIGTSFVVFEAVSYLVDIYRRDAEPGSFWDALLFISFFPKLTSGPIILWRDFSDQLRRPAPTLAQISSGLQRIIIGYAKKAIIADSLGAQGFSISESILLQGSADTVSLWLNAVMYFFQLYYDFSGYSDISIGLARIFGFSWKENFKFPYISRSITEFWRRWHISLGTWFREYIYIPLGGNRRGNVYLNLLIVFFLTGVWHGANWAFILWGLLHGIVMLLERCIRDKHWYRLIPGVCKWAFTMMVVFFGWILFMSGDWKDFTTTINQMFSYRSGSSYDLSWRYFASQKILILLVIAMLGSILPVFPFKKQLCRLHEQPAVLLLEKLGLLVLLVTSILFVVNSSYSPFLYFQF
ncbi:MAG: MBOAT family O-acyltransferase [Lachnospiraceae bacterium]|nr:MBOAT family protein [Lachnospiraceae bacterium]MDY5741741.1 MBOAT family O-acyltransferase [Lachnospiraceae bacterium]